MDDECEEAAVTKGTNAPPQAERPPEEHQQNSFTSVRWRWDLLTASLCFRIKIEEEYAKNLSKLSLSPLAAQEEGWVQ